MGEGGGGRRMYVSGLNVSVNTAVDVKSVYLLCRLIRVQISFSRINFIWIIIFHNLGIRRQTEMLMVLHRASLNFIGRNSYGASVWCSKTPVFWTPGNTTPADDLKIERILARSSLISKPFLSLGESLICELGRQSSVSANRYYIIQILQCSANLKSTFPSYSNKQNQVNSFKGHPFLFTV